MPKNKYHSQMILEVKMTEKKGRGVFALVDFRVGDVVEVCPAIATLRYEDCPDPLEPFPYEWSKTKCAVVGGLASFYNHNPVSPNVDYYLDKKSKSYIFTCIAPIAIGDELCFDYSVDVEFEVKK